MQQQLPAAAEPAASTSGHPLGHIFPGDGEVARRLRDLDWSRTELGDPELWPQSLKTIVRVMLASRYAMWLAWGRGLTFLCNDAYLPTVGIKRDWVLGACSRTVWEEIWPDIGPRIEHVLRTGQATWDADLLLFLERSGYSEETYHTFSYSPVADDDNRIQGMLCVVTEATERVVGERRLTLLRNLASRLTSAKSADEVFRASCACIAAQAYDLPFTLTYLLDDDGSRARLAYHTGVGADADIAPAELELATPLWPLAEAIRELRPVKVDGLAARFRHVPPAIWGKPPALALVLPIAQQGQTRPAGVFIAGLNPYRPADEAYLDFLKLFVAQIAAALANAQAYEAERRRAAALAELDRAKSAFFSNTSHEFRTPLTLMMGPLEDMLRDHRLDAAARAHLAIAYRNSRRLLKLVNALLDFSRIEADRMQALYEPTDLAHYTEELTSVFRSAIEKARLSFVVECAPIGEPVYVDREMWEKIILNLVSNAFKHTLKGEIRVTFARRGDQAELRVADTGTGIPAQALSRVFERFYRVPGARGRTHEGTGIGLALVHELVKLHGGTIGVESRADVGTTFTVTLPLGRAHLPADRIRAPRTPDPAAPAAAQAYVDEALRWLPEHTRGEDLLDARSGDPAPPPPVAGPAGTVLVVDDNADMRDYLRRLLSGRFHVLSAADGAEALELVRETRPDLVLSDIMMPRLDGYGLLHALRDDPRTRELPIILLSARAGEEARVEGFAAGADDYLTKPFSARELLARVGSHMELARVRRDAAARERLLRDEVEAARDRLEAVLASISDAFATLDRDWRLRYVNARAAAGCGLAKEDILGRCYWELFPELVGTAFDAEARRVMAERREGRCEVYHPRGEQWFEHRLYPSPEGGLTLLSADITERKRAEEALHAKDQDFRAMFEFSSVGMAQADPATARLVRVNDKLGEITGYAVDELVGKSVYELTHPDDLAANRQKFEQMLRDEIPYYALEKRLVRKDGAPVWVHVNVALLRDKHGRPLRTTAVVVDITDRKQAEEALREADRRKDEFLATLAHELRNPLAPIRHATDIARSPGASAEQIRWSHDVIDRQVEHMTLLLGDLLDVSRITRGQLTLRKERIALAAVLDAALESARPLIDRRRHALEIALPPEPLWLDADPLRLAQVFSNLLTNAAKYTDAGGTIRITAACDGGGVAVRIADTGIGIEREALSKIFQMFSQVQSAIDRTADGLGIGLALSQGLVMLHGGTIDAESEGPGRGSVFTVRLPGAAAPEDAAAARAPTPAAPAAQPRRRVLVVDDNRDAAESLALLVGLDGHEVRLAHDGRSALAVGAEFEPDVMLLDIGMPELNGYEVAERVRALAWGHKLTLVALTGWGQREDRERALQMGFDHHLTKPIDFGAVRELIAAPPP